MSNINEIKDANRRLGRYLNSVKQQQAMDGEEEEEWNQTIRDYDAEIKPMQEEFMKKLKAYLELSDEYFNKYVRLSDEQNRMRKEDWNNQLYRYENYWSYYSTLRSEVNMSQRTWDASNNELGRQYDAAMTSWNNTSSELQAIITRREREATAGIEASRNRRNNYRRQFDTGYYDKLEQVHRQRTYALEAWNPIPSGHGIQQSLKVLTGWGSYLRSNLGAIDHTSMNIKRVYVVDGWDHSHITGICGEQASKIFNKPFRIDVGSHSGNGSKQVNLSDSGLFVSPSPMNLLPPNESDIQYRVNQNGRKLMVSRSGGGSWSNNLILAGSKKGSPDAYNIWGSGASGNSIYARMPVIPSKNNGYGSHTNYTIDNVPKMIWYALGPWAGRGSRNREDVFFGGPADTSQSRDSFSKGWKVLWTTLWIDPERINDSSSREFIIFGAFDDYAYIYINGKKVNKRFAAGWGRNGERRNQITLKKKDWLYPGNNFILIHAKNTGGPGMVCMGMSSVYQDGPHWDDILVNTNEKWWCFETNVTLPKKGTMHTGTTNGNPNNEDLLNERWVKTFHERMENMRNWMGRVPGAPGVHVHDYEPPNAKVKYVRIDYAQKPATKPSIQISQLAVYPVDNMELNVARGQKTTGWKDWGETHTYSGNTPNRYGDNPSKAVDGNLRPRYFPNMYHSDGEGGWDKQFWQVELREPVNIYKIVYYGRDGGWNDRAIQMRIRLYDKHRNLVFSGPPFGSQQLEQSFYFNHPVETVGVNIPPKPVRQSMPESRPTFQPEPNEPPVMKPYETPDIKLLKKVKKAADELIQMNMRIQDVYKRYVTDGLGIRYQNSVLQRRKELLNGVMMMLKEREILNLEIDEYRKTAFNQGDLEKQAIANQIYYWLWGCIAILSIIMFFIFYIWPQYTQNSVPIISWSIIIMMTLLTTIYIGGSIPFLLWIFILVNIFFYLIQKRYGGRIE
jgi:hypothetical protein